MTGINELIVEKGNEIIEKSEELPSPKKFGNKATSYIADVIDYIIRFFKETSDLKINICIFLVVLYVLYKIFF